MADDLNCQSLQISEAQSDGSIVHAIHRWTKDYTINTKGEKMCLQVLLSLHHHSNGQQMKS